MSSLGSGQWCVQSPVFSICLQFQLQTPAGLSDPHDASEAPPTPCRPQGSHRMQSGYHQAGSGPLFLQMRKQAGRGSDLLHPVAGRPGTRPPLSALPPSWAASQVPAVPWSLSGKTKNNNPTGDLGSFSPFCLNAGMFMTTSSKP